MTEPNYLTSREVRDRYSISDMSLWRWLRDPALNFPKPLIIRRRRLWLASDLDAFDARQRESSEAA